MWPPQLIILISLDKLSIGRYYLSRGDYGLALTYLTKAVQRDPLLSVAWCYVAEAKAKQRKCEEKC